MSPVDLRRVPQNFMSLALSSRGQYEGKVLGPHQPHSGRCKVPHDPVSRPENDQRAISERQNIVSISLELWGGTSAIPRILL
jgi:hypothetical protein